MSEDNESQNSGDIQVPADQMKEFFFMDTDEEEEKYGASTKGPASLMTGNVAKEAKDLKVSWWCEINGVFIGQQTQANYGIQGQSA